MTIVSTAGFRHAIAIARMRVPIVKVCCERELPWDLGRDECPMETPA